MDKNTKIGFVTTADKLLPVFEAFVRLSKEMGRELSRDEKAFVAESLLGGGTITLGQLEEMAKGKKILIVKNNENESL